MIQNYDQILYCDLCTVPLTCFIVYFYYILEKRLKVFLDTLLELNEAGANFSDEELRDEVVTMMIGVSKTKSSKIMQKLFE